MRMKKTKCKSVEAEISSKSKTGRSTGKLHQKKTEVVRNRGKTCCLEAKKNHVQAQGGIVVKELPHPLQQAQELGCRVSFQRTVKSYGWLVCKNNHVLDKMELVGIWPTRTSTTLFLSNSEECHKREANCVVADTNMMV